MGEVTARAAATEARDLSRASRSHTPARGLPIATAIQRPSSTRRRRGALPMPTPRRRPQLPSPESRASPLRSGGREEAFDQRSNGPTDPRAHLQRLRGAAVTDADPSAPATASDPSHLEGDRGARMAFAQVSAHRGSPARGRAWPSRLASLLRARAALGNGDVAGALRTSRPPRRSHLRRAWVLAASLAASVKDTRKAIALSERDSGSQGESRGALSRASPSSSATRPRWPRGHAAQSAFSGIASHLRARAVARRRGGGSRRCRHSELSPSPQRGAARGYPTKKAGASTWSWPPREGRRTLGVSCAATTQDRASARIDLSTRVLGTGRRAESGVARALQRDSTGLPKVSAASRSAVSLAVLRTTSTRSRSVAPAR